jgi:Ca-activated chloride channel family protein
MADLSGGHFYRATNRRELQNIYNQIDRLEKSEVKLRRFATYEPLYVGPLLAALGLLALEIILVNTKFRRVP